MTKVLTDEEIKYWLAQIEAYPPTGNNISSHWGTLNRALTELVTLRRQLKDKTQEAKDWREWAKEIDDDDQVKGHDIAYQELLNKYPEDR